MRPRWPHTTSIMNRWITNIPKPWTIFAPYSNLNPAGGSHQSSEKIWRAHESCVRQTPTLHHLNRIQGSLKKSTGDALPKKVAIKHCCWESNCQKHKFQPSIMAWIFQVQLGNKFHCRTFNVSLISNNHNKIILWKNMAVATWHSVCLVKSSPGSKDSKHLN